MKFAIFEGDTAWLDFIQYWGVIGFFYDSTLGGILAYLIVGVICLFAVIGLLATIKWLFTRKRKKKTAPGENWLKTGKL